MKRTAASGVKQILKPCAYKVSEPLRGSWRAFCLMSLRVSVRGKLKAFWAGGAGKPSPKWANESRVLDPKRW